MGDCCYVDFYSCEANRSGVDFDSRFIRSGGNASGGGGVLNYIATSHQFNGMEVLLQQLIKSLV